MKQGFKSKADQATHQPLAARWILRIYLVLIGIGLTMPVIDWLVH